MLGDRSAGLSVNGIAVDSTGVHVAAMTGTADRYQVGKATLAVVYKFDTDGNLLWTHQTTTSKALPAESATRIALNGGAVYVVGLTESLSSSLNQVNVVVPGLARTNAADAVVLTVNGVPANQVTLPVGPP